MPPDHLPEDDEIDVFELLEVLWSHWHWIVGTALIGITFGAAGWLALAPYKSSVNLIDRPLPHQEQGSLSFVDWRRLLPQINVWAQAALRDADPAQDDALMRALSPLATPEGLSQVLDPQYAVDKASIKNLGNLEGVAASDILSIKVSHADRVPERLLRVLDLRAQFVRDAVLRESYRRLQEGLEASLRSDDAKLRQTRAQLLVEQRDATERLGELKRLKRTLPELSRFDNAQVLDPKGANAKYLPLAVQMMALETDTQGLRSKLRDNQEAQAALSLRQEVVEVLKRSLQEGVPGAFEGIRAARERLLADDQAPGTMRDLEAQRLNVQLSAALNARSFGLSLEAPLKPERGKLALVMALAGLASGFVAVMGVLLVSAWRKRRVMGTQA